MAFLRTAASLKRQHRAPDLGRPSPPQPRGGDRRSPRRLIAVVVVIAVIAGIPVMGMPAIAAPAIAAPAMLAPFMAAPSVVIAPAIVGGLGRSGGGEPADGAESREGGDGLTHDLLRGMR